MDLPPNCALCGCPEHEHDPQGGECTLEKELSMSADYLCPEDPLWPYPESWKPFIKREGVNVRKKSTTATKTRARAKITQRRVEDRTYEARHRNALKRVQEMVTKTKDLEIRKLKDEIQELQEELELRNEPFVWRTMDGVQVTPNAMDEDHLRNVVSYTQRRLMKAMLESTWLSGAAKYARAFYEFLAECERRGIDV
jgi:hypothetical protein